MGPLGIIKLFDMFCRKCMVNLHRVGYHNKETTKGNLLANEIEKDDVNQSLIDSWYHPCIYISGEVQYRE